MKKKLSLKNIYLLSVIGIGLIGLALGSTYAMFITNIEIDNPISLNTNLSSENDIIETVEVTVPSGDHIEVPLTINNQSSSTLNYSTFYVSSSSNIEVGTKLSNSDSSIPTGTISSNTTKKVYVQIKNNTSSSLTITLGVSSSINNIVLSSSMTIVPNTELVFGKNLLEYITNLYSKTGTASDGQDTYDYDTTHKLMKDPGANIRYYGDSPNNYIYFNCDNYSNQTSDTCEVWRIIGVVDNKIKLIRNENLGILCIDNGKTKTTGYNNNWSTASLNQLLNTNYLEKGADVSYVSGKSRNTITTELKTSEIGINDATRNMISDGIWYLRGPSSDKISIKQIYNMERTTGSVYGSNPTVYPVSGVTPTWPPKIGLMSASDYGYAADFNYCKKTLYYYGDTTCSSKNWLNDGNYQWLLTPYPSDAYSVWSIVSGGTYTGTAVYNNQTTTRPVLYLETTIKINNDGDGSSTNPYQIVS